MLIDHSDFRSASLQWRRSKRPSYQDGKLDKAGKARVVGFNPLLAGLPISRD